MKAEIPGTAIPGPTPRPAVLLDRDGTVTEDRGYARTAEEIVLLPGAGRAIRALNQAEVAVVLVTNQSGVGRGYFTLADLALQHQALVRLLALEGAVLDGIYFCPHRPEDRCACRKPGAALVEEAAADLELDLARSWVVGDRADDLLLAQHGLAGGLLVRTGQGAATWESFRATLRADWSFPDLEAAVAYVLGQIPRPRARR
jgi:histidinol-phosphate phosphatase family protein